MDKLLVSHNAYDFVVIDGYRSKATKRTNRRNQNRLYSHPLKAGGPLYNQMMCKNIFPIFFVKGIWITYSVIVD